MEKMYWLLVSGVLLVGACTATQAPTSPTLAGAASGPVAHLGHAMGGAEMPTAANPEGPGQQDKGYIDGWFNGAQVQLYYTKTYFCAEPPVSGADGDGDKGCELGADAETAPRPGPIPTIYAIAAAGIQPDLATLACRPGTVCLNHPAMIDASRVGGRANGPAVPHSHILSEHGGGWFHTVNIRVRNLDVWNQIAVAKSLEKVRELQADPIVGVNGQTPGITADTPTNIFFFIASWRPVHE
jgi:hypothetical protein